MFLVPSFNHLTLLFDAEINEIYYMNIYQESVNQNSTYYYYQSRVETVSEKSSAPVSHITQYESEVRSLLAKATFRVV